MRVVVLGAGVIGVTTAYRLADAGHDVTVIDRQSGPGLETSFANGGLITPATSDSWAAPGTPLKILKWLGKSDAPIRLRLHALPGLLNWGTHFLINCRADRWRANTEAVLALALFSLDDLGRLIEAERIDYDRNKPGLLKLFRDPVSMANASRAAELFRAFGVRAETLDAGETVRVEPALAPIQSHLLGAVHYPDDESGDAFKFTQALAERARDRGATFLFNRTVLGLRRAGDRIEIVVTDQGPVSGDMYVLAAGSYSRRLARSAGLSLPVYPGKGYSITVNAEGWNGVPRIPVADDALKAAVTPLGGKLRVAGTVEFTGFDPSLDAARGRMLESNLSAILPERPNGEVKHWAGLRPMTPTGRPLIGRTCIPNLLVNTGHGPLGWTLAAGSAQIIAAIANGTSPPIDSAPFRPA